MSESLEAASLLDQGKRFLLQGDLEQAARAFSRAVEIEPNCGPACACLGEAYRLLGRYPEAVEALRQAVEINPADAEARYSLGRSYLALGWIYKALAQQWMLRKLDPELAHDLLNLLLRSTH